MGLLSWQSEGGKTKEGGAGAQDVESSRKAYYKEFKKVLEASDVVIEVLDARDPIGSRCIALEKAVLASGTNKKLVLLLNKVGKGGMIYSHGHMIWTISFQIEKLLMIKMKQI